MLILEKVVPFETRIKKQIEPNVRQMNTNNAKQKTHSGSFDKEHGRQ